MPDLDEFFEEFDELASTIRYAQYDYVPQHLKRWFGVFRDAPEPTRGRLSWLESLSNWDAVSPTAFSGLKGSFVGSGTIEWPEKREDRLSLQLQLFRRIASGDIEAFNFAHDYFYVDSNNINDLVQEFLGQVFDPFVAELRRYLRRNAETEIPGTRDVSVPASDRLVRIDHNSSTYSETLDGIDRLRAAVGESNSIDAETKERVVGELLAGTELLKPRVARETALKTVLLTVLTWLSLEFASTAVGQIAQVVIDQLKLLIDFLI